MLCYTPGSLVGACLSLVQLKSLYPNADQFFYTIVQPSCTVHAVHEITVGHRTFSECLRDMSAQKPFCSGKLSER